MLLSRQTNLRYRLFFLQLIAIVKADNTLLKLPKGNYIPKQKKPSLLILSFRCIAECRSLCSIGYGNLTGRLSLFFLEHSNAKNIASQFTELQAADRTGLIKMALRKSFREA